MKIMTVKERKEKSEIIGGNIPCPNGEPFYVRTYGCLNCNYCNGAYDNISVYCGYKLKESE